MVAQTSCRHVGSLLTMVLRIALLRSLNNTRSIILDRTGPMPKRENRNFARKVHAFNAGLCVSNCAFDIIGNLDADISFDPDYLEFLVRNFPMTENLASRELLTPRTAERLRDSFEGEVSVPGACQFFRRECFTDIGGYTPNPAGGIDWIAVTTARMRGWKTRNFPESRYHHYRNMGTAERSPVGAMFDTGKGLFSAIADLGDIPIGI